MLSLSFSLFSIIVYIIQEAYASPPTSSFFSGVLWGHESEVHGQPTILLRVPHAVARAANNPSPCPSLLHGQLTILLRVPRCCTGSQLSPCPSRCCTGSRTAGLSVSLTLLHGQPTILLRVPHAVARACRAGRLPISKSAYCRAERLPIPFPQFLPAMFQISVLRGKCWMFLFCGGTVVGPNACQFQNRLFCRAERLPNSKSTFL